MVVACQVMSGFEKCKHWFSVNIDKNHDFCQGNQMQRATFQQSKYKKITRYKSVELFFWDKLRTLKKEQPGVSIQPETHSTHIQLNTESVRIKVQFDLNYKLIQVFRKKIIIINYT